MSRVNTKKEKKPKDPVIIVLDVIIVLLIFVMIFVGAKTAFYKILANESSFSEDASMMAFELQQGDYAALIQDKYMNEFNGNTKPAAYHALADYVEASFLYKINDTKGYTDRANEQKAAMEESRANMKELEVFADKVDQMFK